MADFSMNVNYAKPQTTSLADMINMAGGIQNYQQAQQMNYYMPYKWPERKPSNVMPWYLFAPAAIKQRARVMAIGI